MPTTNSLLTPKRLLIFNSLLAPIACLAVCAALLVACRYGTSRPADDAVNPDLLRLVEAPPITIADALQALAGAGEASTEDREFAYWAVRQRPPKSAADHYAVAAMAGRVAQLKGLNAGDQIAALERHSRASIALDPEFRFGVARRLLGTVYVMAPGRMLDHGDSETGLEMLEALAQAWPDNVQHRLRLAEAYVALGDPEPAEGHVCYCLAHSSGLSGEDLTLLADLKQETEVSACETMK